MSEIPVWQDYDPDTGIGNPATPLSAANLNAWAAALEATVAGVVHTGDLVVNVKDYGAVGDGATDDTAAIDAAIAAATTLHAAVYFPAGQYVSQGGHVLNEVSVHGTPNPGAQPYHGEGGSTVLAVGTTEPLFTVGPYVTMTDLVVIYPNQVDTPTAPIVYPPTFAGIDAVRTTNLRMDRVSVYNAYDLMDLPLTGLVDITEMRAYTINSGFTFEDAPEYIKITGGFFSFGFYNTETMHFGGGTAAGSTFALRTRTSTQAAWITITGTGSSTTQPPESVDALYVSDCFVFGYRHGLLVDGGYIMNSSIRGGGMDAVLSAVTVRNYGLTYGLAVDGVRFYGYSFDDVALDDALFNLTSAAPMTQAPQGSHLSITGCWLGFGRGPVLKVNGTGWERVMLSDNEWRYYGKATGGGASPYYALDINAPGCTVLSSDEYYTDGLTAGGVLKVTDVGLMRVSNLTIGQTWEPVNVTGGNVVIDGIRVTTTGAAASLAGNQANLTVRDADVDKPTSTFGDWLVTTADASGKTLRFMKSRAGGAVTSGDALGSLAFRGHSGTAFGNSAQVLASVDAAPSGAIVPGRLAFLTTTDAGALTEQFRIDRSGNLIAKAAHTVVNNSGHLQLRSYTVATLPAATPAAQLIYVSNGTTNKRLAVSDGTNWRWPDGAVVS